MYAHKVNYLLVITDLNNWKWGTNTSAVIGLIYKKNIWLSYFLITLCTFSLAGKLIKFSLTWQFLSSTISCATWCNAPWGKIRHYLVPHWSHCRPTTINTINLNFGWCAFGATPPSWDSSHYLGLCSKYVLTIHWKLAKEYQQAWHCLGCLFCEFT